MKDADKFIIFTNGNLFSLLILKDFLIKNREDIVKVVIVTGDYKGKSGIKAIWDYFKSTATSYFLYKIFTVALVFYFRLEKEVEISSVAGFCDRLGIDYKRVSNINDDLFYQDLRQLKADFLVSVSCPQLIKEKLLALFNYRGINIHSSLLPAYAGLAPYFWVLAKGESVTGTSVHYLSKSFDEGNLLVQKNYQIKDGESVFGLFLKLALIGSEAIQEATKKLTQGYTGDIQNIKDSTYFSNPQNQDIKDLRRNGHKLLNKKDIAVLRKELKKLNSCSP